MPRFHSIVRFITVAAFLAAGTTAAAAVHHPQQIAQACISHVTETAQHCAMSNIAIAQECADQIEQFVEQGEVQQALAVALHCSVFINRRSARCVHHINHRAGHCVQLLLFLHAPGLAQAVNEARQQAVGAVNASRQAALAIIENALQ